MNSSDYDKKMGRAKKSADDFGASLAKGIGSAAGKVAGALGLAMGAAEGFERAIRGSQTTSDEYDRVMRSAKTSVDSFFTAISTGDFTAFHQGLDGIIAKARNAQSAIDQLGNTTMSYNYFNTKNQAEFAEAITTLRDKEATTDQRAAAIATANRIMGDQKEITNQLKRRSENVVNALVTEMNNLGVNDVARADIEDVLRLDVSAMSEEEKAALSARYKEYVNYRNKLASSQEFKSLQFNASTGTYTQKTDWDAVNRAMQPMNEQYKDAILFNEILVKRSDEWLQNLIQILGTSDNAVRNLANMERQLNRASQATPRGTGGGGTAAEIIPSGSIAELEKSIQAARKAYTTATTDAARQAAYQTLQELERRKGVIELHARVVMPPSGQKGGSITDLAEGIGKLPPITFEPVKAESVDNIRKINDEIAIMTNLMGMMNGVTIQGAEGWLQWMADVIQATSTAITAIRGVVMAKQAEGAASAGASAAQSGPFGWLMIAPAIAAAIAAFAAIPKFAEGGIVGGSSFFGDKLLARVNSGEMILNQKQQGRLLGALETPHVVVDGEARVSGKDIYISLRNYMKATGNRL